MSDLTYYTNTGVAVGLTADGHEAVLDSEFCAWTVRWCGDDRGAPFVRVGHEVLELKLTGEGYVVPPRKKGDKYKRNVRFIGIVTLYADRACTVPLRPWLRVQPANMPAELFATLLQDMQALALEVSIYLAAVRSQAPAAAPGVGSPSLLSSWIAAARAAEACLDAYDEQLPLIDRRPAKALKSRTTLIEAGRAVRRGYAQHVFKWPESRRFMPVPTRVYTTETLEARFVASTLSEVCRDGAAFASLLGARLADVERSAAEASDATRKFGARVMPGGGRGSAATVAEARQIVRRLRAKAPRLRARVAGVDSDPAATSLRTNRLRMSAEYRPLLDAWEEYRREVAVSARQAELVSRIDERSIAKSATLYERWATLKIYSALVARGFLPPDGALSLLDAIAIEDHAIEYLNGDQMPLRLSRLCGGVTVDLVLKHEPTIQEGRRPDLVIDARAGGKRETWVIDHKYKDYSLPAPDYDRELERLYGSHFLADLVGVAEKRYRSAMDADVGAIVHPDADPQFTHWDPGPGHLNDELRAPTPHAHLSVALRPGAVGNSNITTLIRLLLGYRLGLMSTCWRCGTDCARRDVPGSRGDGYRCDGCGAYWIAHWCQRCKHRPLLKFGGASFHRVEPNDVFNVHCPRCGDYFHGGRAPYLPRDVPDFDIY